jgi:hypothetical protein
LFLPFAQDYVAAFIVVSDDTAGEAELREILILEITPLHIVTSSHM